MLAKALAADGKREEAIARAKEALNLAPTDNDLKEFLGTLLNEQIDERGESINR
jgi:Flp pilus assembly protein TadD